jgi:hypothetical protein
MEIYRLRRQQNISFEMDKWILETMPNLSAENFKIAVLGRSHP